MPYFRVDQATLSAVEGYSASFYENTLEAVGDKNYIASPFGSWLLLAVLAGSTDFSGVPEREAEVTSILGLPIAEALASSKTILENISGAEIGIGAWFDPDYALLAPRIASWLQANTLGTTESRVPPQDEMDAWTQEVTHGLIKKFPIEITPELMFLVASVIYTKFEWREPYDVVESAQHPHLAFWETERALFSDDANIGFYQEQSPLRNHLSEIVYAVHYRSAADGQQVMSVIPIGAEVTELQLLSVAHKISSNHASFKRLSYADVAALIPSSIPNGTPADLDSNLSLVWDENLYSDSASIYLPAWEAENTHDLALPTFGFAAEAETLIIGYPGEDDGFQAKQTAIAKYGAKGFEAAAVTAFGMLRAAGMPQRTGGYVATLVFDRPFVSLCLVNSIPLFSAFVRTAVEA